MSNVFGGSSSKAIAAANASATKAQQTATEAKEALEKQVSEAEKKAEERKANPVVIPTQNDEEARRAAEEERARIARMSGRLSTLLTGASGKGDTRKAPTRSSLG